MGWFELTSFYLANLMPTIVPRGTLIRMESQTYSSLLLIPKVAAGMYGATRRCIRHVTFRKVRLSAVQNVMLDRIITNFFNAYGISSPVFS